MMIHYRFLWEELRYGGKQALTFIICVALSIAPLTATGSTTNGSHHCRCEDQNSQLFQFQHEISFSFVPNRFHFLVLA